MAAKKMIEFMDFEEAQESEITEMETQEPEIVPVEESQEVEEALPPQTPIGKVDLNGQYHAWERRWHWGYEREVDFYADSGYTPDLVERAIAAVKSAFNSEHFSVEPDGSSTTLPKFSPSNRLVVTVEIIEGV